MCINVHMHTVDHQSWNMKYLQSVIVVNSYKLFIKVSILWETISLDFHAYTTGADIRSVCTEAGMFAIRARRKVTQLVYV